MGPLFFCIYAKSLRNAGIRMVERLLYDIHIEYTHQEENPKTALSVLQACVATLRMQANATT
jgi:hypothetical protein